VDAPAWYQRREHLDSVMGCSIAAAPQPDRNRHPPCYATTIIRGGNMSDNQLIIAQKQQGAEGEAAPDSSLC
jgi:hypothetical protein